MPGREKNYSLKIYWAGAKTGSGVANYRDNKAPVLLPAQEDTSRQESIKQHYETGFRKKRRSQ